MKSIIQICFLIGLMPFFSGFTRPDFSKNDDGRGPLITANVAATTLCKSGNTCGQMLGSLKKWHGFKITLTGASITYYNSNFTYTIYEGADPYQGTSQIVATPLASFSCNQNVVQYNGGVLDNSKTYSVIISTAGASGLVVFNTGTGKGTNCVSKGDTNIRN